MDDPGRMIEFDVDRIDDEAYLQEQMMKVWRWRLLAGLGGCRIVSRTETMGRLVTVLRAVSDRREPLMTTRRHGRTYILGSFRVDPRRTMGRTRFRRWWRGARLQIRRQEAEELLATFPRT